MTRTDLARYVRLLERRWKLMLSVVVVVVGASLIQSWSATEQYEATSRVVILSELAGDILIDGPGRDLDRVQQTERRSLESTRLEESVEDELGTEVDVRFETQAPDLLLITARSPIPAEAAEVANTYATTFVAQREAEAVERLNVLREQLIAQIDRLQVEIDRWEQVLATDPGNRLANVSLEARLAQQGALFADLDALDFRIASENGGLVVGEPAEIPTDPVSPQPVRSALFALVLGLILAIVIALARDALDDTIRSAKDIDDLDLGAPILGAIPPSSQDGSAITTVEAPESSAAEAYRALRAAVLHALGGRERVTIQVTSSYGDEGETAVATNLAVALALVGLRTAVVDADFRSTAFRQRFPDLPEEGLAEMLCGFLPADHSPSIVGGSSLLSALPAGTPILNPAEMLSSARAREVFDALRRSHDVTIIATPAVLGYAEANVVANLVDTTIVVARSEVTTAERLSRTFQVLTLVEVNVLGVVLTDASDTSYRRQDARRSAPRLRRWRSPWTAGAQPGQATSSVDGSGRHLPPPGERELDVGRHGEIAR
jgi:capsular exopolysaccharide synthesis family protein